MFTSCVTDPSLSKVCVCGVCVCVCVCVSYKTSSFCKDLITFANVLANWSVGNEDAVDPKPVAVPAVGLQAGR